MSTTEELLERKSSGFGIEIRDYGRRDPPRWPRNTLSPQKLVLTLPTSGGRLIGIVRSRTKATEFFIHTQRTLHPEKGISLAWVSACSCSHRKIMFVSSYSTSFKHINLNGKGKGVPVLKHHDKKTTPPTPPPPAHVFMWWCLIKQTGHFICASILVSLDVPTTAAGAIREYMIEISNASFPSRYREDSMCAIVNRILCWIQELLWLLVAESCKEFNKSNYQSKPGVKSLIHVTRWWEFLYPSTQRCVDGYKNPITWSLSRNRMQTPKINIHVTLCIVVQGYVITKSESPWSIQT
jgi:hypothetical protein